MMSLKRSHSYKRYWQQHLEEQRLFLFLCLDRGHSSVLTTPEHPSALVIMDFERSIVVGSGTQVIKAKMTKCLMLHQNLKVYFSGDLVHDVVLLHHGAGYTAKTWLALISQLKSSLPSVCFVAWDMRGHGASKEANGNTAAIEMSLDSLVSDVNAVLHAILAQTTKKLDFFLIGHSLGASVLAAFAAKHHSSLQRCQLHGLVMVDIIEDTAVAALERMPAILADIPKSFTDFDEALRWSLRGAHSHHFPGLKANDFIRASLKSQLTTAEDGRMHWISDLSLMQPFWNDWFTGLTDNFLSLSGSRMLVLAGTDYMDRAMTVAQMQGKFQLVVVRDSGHAIQEDQPGELARPIISMIEKHLKLLEILRSKAEK